jgi:hypothetical protein
VDSGSLLFMVLSFLHRKKNPRPLPHAPGGTGDHLFFFFDRPDSPYTARRSPTNSS